MLNNSRNLATLEQRKPNPDLTYITAHSYKLKQKSIHIKGPRSFNKKRRGWPLIPPHKQPYEATCMLRESIMLLTKTGGEASQNGMRAQTSKERNHSCLFNHHVVRLNKE